MCKDYEESIKTSHSTAENTIDFSDQPLKLSCGKWIANDKGVFCIDRVVDPVYACTHPIMVIARLIDLETKVDNSFLLQIAPINTVRIDRALVNTKTQGLIECDTKTSDRRTLKLPQQTMDLLKAFREEQQHWQLQYGDS